MEKDEKAEEEKPEGAAAEATEGENGLDPPKKKLSPKMMAIIGVAALVLLGGIGAGLYFGGVFGGNKGEVAAAGDAHGAQKAEGGGGHGASAEAEKGPTDAEHENAAPKYYPLGDILVNLSGDGKRPNFLKIKVSLELASEKDVGVLDTLKPRIIDNFQVYLRELRVEDLRGSAGLYRLREELLLRVTEVVQPVRVRDVLFLEMLVQ